MIINLLIGKYSEREVDMKNRGSFFGKAFVVFALLLIIPSSVGSALAETRCEKLKQMPHLVVGKDVIEDNLSGLAWKSCLAGQTFEVSACSGEAAELSWLDAEEFSKRVVAENGRSWRLPTLEDIATILEENCSASPFFILFKFGVKGEIWTASPGFPVNDVAAVVSLQDGKVWGLGKGVKRYFWLVSDLPD